MGSCCFLGPAPSGRGGNCKVCYFLFGFMLEFTPNGSEHVGPLRPDGFYIQAGEAELERDAQRSKVLVSGERDVFVI